MADRLAAGTAVAAAEGAAMSGERPWKGPVRVGCSPVSFSGVCLTHPIRDADNRTLAIVWQSHEMADAIAAALNAAEGAGERCFKHERALPCDKCELARLQEDNARLRAREANGWTDTSQRWADRVRTLERERDLARATIARLQAEARRVREAIDRLELATLVQP